MLLFRQEERQFKHKTKQKIEFPKNRVSLICWLFLFRFLQLLTPFELVWNDAVRSVAGCKSQAVSSFSLSLAAGAARDPASDWATWLQQPRHFHQSRTPLMGNFCSREPSWVDKDNIKSSTEAALLCQNQGLIGKTLYLCIQFYVLGFYI